MIELSSARLRASIAPQFGGGLARLDWHAGGVIQPVLRPWSGSGVPRPSQLACFALVPWSNRMAGGFSHAGRSWQIPPNRDDDPYPMHGHGWQHPWTVAEHRSAHARLVYAHRGDPFSYDATLDYTLDGEALAVTLAVVNRGALALPFGLGLHPWLPRRDGVTLHAPAQAVWLAGPDKLPIQRAALPPEWDFNTARTLPAGGLDHLFDGWNGWAQVHWPDSGMRLSIEADCAYYIAYAPAGGEFFCVEPVDHLINAHNMAQPNGLTVLAPGERLQRRCRFGVMIEGAARDGADDA